MVLAVKTVYCTKTKDIYGENILWIWICCASKTKWHFNLCNPNLCDPTSRNSI